MKNRFLIVGMGGVGSQLLPSLINYIAHHEKFKEESEVIFIDGDVYEPKNKERQIFGKYGNKANVKYDEYNSNELYYNIEFDHYTQYITNENIQMFIKDYDYVFICVDNHNTRKLISKYCENNINNITIISGGNEYIDGNVQIYIKRNGKEVTPSLTKYHPEIETPKDKNPEDMSCQELAISEPQLIFANMGVATFMCFAFYNIINENYKYSESYFDIELMSADGKIRNI